MTGDIKGALLPCPHCGCLARLHCDGSIFEGAPGWRVECEGTCHSMTCYWHTEAEAISAWNTRAALQSVPDGGEARGTKLTPREPTSAMRRAADERQGTGNPHVDIWVAMWDAAPPPDGSQERAWMVRGAELVRVLTDEQEARELAASFGGVVIPLYSNPDAKKCPTCADSDRPGFIVAGHHFDRQVQTDVIGETRLTSGKDYVRCWECSGTGNAAPPPDGSQEDLDAWIEEEFSGYGIAVREKGDPPIPGEPFMSMQEAKELTRQAVAKFAARPPDSSQAGTEWRDEVRPEVAAFALLMEKELHANDHKRGWKEDTAIDLASRVQEEAKELFEAAYALKFPELWKSHPAPTAVTIAEEAADVANMAMMVADVCGCLAAPPPDGSQAGTGWREESTQAMVQAGYEAYLTDNVKDSSVQGKIRRIYQAMCAARPTPSDPAPTEALHAGAGALPYRCPQCQERKLRERFYWGNVYEICDNCGFGEPRATSPSSPVAPQGEQT